DGAWPRSPAEAIRYALARRPDLTRFLDDGRIELDNNPVERAIRPIALGRKNYPFAGSDGGVPWPTICSLTATAKLTNVEPLPGSETPRARNGRLRTGEQVKAGRPPVTTQILTP